MKNIFKKIITILLYFSVFYILSSLLKFIYMFIINIFNINRIVVFNLLYLDEIVISIIILMYIYRHIKIEQNFIN